MLPTVVVVVIIIIIIIIIIIVVAVVVDIIQCSLSLNLNLIILKLSAIMSSQLNHLLWSHIKGGHLHLKVDTHKGASREISNLTDK